MRGLLTDFDWAGSVGKAKYPATLNISDIDWAGGVLVVAPAGPNQKRKMTLEMLEKLDGDMDK